MPRAGLKIKDLARELETTSRTLIDLCRTHGLPVQNSITRISYADAARVRDWFRDRDHPRPPVGSDDRGRPPR